MFLKFFGQPNTPELQEFYEEVQAEDGTFGKPEKTILAVTDTEDLTKKLATSLETQDRKKALKLGRTLDNFVDEEGNPKDWAYHILSIRELIDGLSSDEYINGFYMNSLEDGTKYLYIFRVGNKCPKINIVDVREKFDQLWIMPYAHYPHPSLHEKVNKKLNLLSKEEMTTAKKITFPNNAMWLLTYTPTTKDNTPSSWKFRKWKIRLKTVVAK